MFEKIKNSKLMFWSLELLILATLVLVSTKIDFVFSPIVTFFSTLFAPILIAGFLYYMVNPLVSFLEKKFELKRTLAVVIVFLLLIGLLILAVSTIIPALVSQVTELLSSLPQFISAVERWSREMMDHPWVQQVDLEAALEKLDLNIGSIIKNFVNGLSSSLGSIMGTVINVALTLVTVPFILFYMLKDGHRLIPAISKFLPDSYADEVIHLLQKMGHTISKYISGQVIECTFVGIFTAIGYYLIGVEYAFLFGTIAGITNMIPYIGPYLGLAPAVLVTLFSEQENVLLKVFLACIVVLVVQQVDGNFIFPNVIGKSLDIHPLTIILILLVAGNIAGLLGMILGVPFYAVCRTVVSHVYDIIQVRKGRLLRESFAVTQEDKRPGTKKK